MNNDVIGRLLEQKTARHCVIHRKAKARFIQLIECLHEEPCEFKMPFGKGFFCKQAQLTMCDTIPKKDVVKNRWTR